MCRTNGSPAGGRALKSNNRDAKPVEVIFLLSAVKGIVGDCESSVVL